MSKPDPPLILASNSPRRRELLAEAGYQFQVLPPAEEVIEDIRPGETAIELVARLAEAKAAAVARRVPRGIVIGCDTVADCQGHILGKPHDRDHARQMLQLLRGKEHRVYSGLCLWRRPDGERQLQVDTTVLKMESISDEQIHEYLDSGLWQGKAGAFGYQDRLGWLHIVSGSESNVVGLPLEMLATMVRGFSR